MEYVRRRRLADARLEVSRGVRILDVALDFGYSSERAFTRAFLQEFGVTPSKLRGAKCSIPNKLRLAKREYKLDGGSMLFSDVRFETFSAMVVASSSVVSCNPEEEVIDFMTQWGARNGIDPRARRFGFDSPVSEDQQKKGQRGYEYWISVPENTPASDGVVLKNIEECKYAVLRITDPFADPFDRIPQAWNRLVEWVSNLEHKHECCQQKYCLEEVIEVDGITYMDLFLPIS